jgi:hypothetical protein
MIAASAAFPRPREQAAGLRAVRYDPRYVENELLIARLRGRDTLTFSLLVDGLRHQIEWPIDFSEYRVLDRPHPIPLQIFSRLGLSGAETLRPHLLRSDLDLLAYYACDTSQYLQNCQDRMDWFFYLDYHVDRPGTPQQEREEAVSDLLAWFDKPNRHSRLRWVNHVTTMLQELVGELKRDGLDTTALLHDARGYMKALIHEYDSTLSLDGYMENRASAIGVKPEVEFCFAYLGQSLPVAERGRAYMMKHLASYLVTLYNDTCSQMKEQDLEQGHVNLKTFLPKSTEYVSFLNETYRDVYSAFRALRPQSPGVLENYWKVCHQWVCGGLVWHLTSRRYNQGQMEISL